MIPTNPGPSRVAGSERAPKRSGAGVLRSLCLLAVLRLVLAGCQPPTTCSLPQGLSCNECFTSDHECSFGGVTVAEPSCDGCQARVALYRELCADGQDVDLETVDAEMECKDT